MGRRHQLYRKIIFPRCSLWQWNFFWLSPIGSTSTTGFLQDPFSRVHQLACLNDKGNNALKGVVHKHRMDDPQDGHGTTGFNPEGDAG